MNGLSETALAARAGTTPEKIKRLAELRILERSPDGFTAADVQRVRLADAFERGGTPLEDISRAIESGDLSLAFLDLLFPEPVVYSERTYRELCEAYGVAPDLVRRVYEALGLPQPSLDDRIREDDAQMFPMAQFSLSLGMNEEAVARVLRVYGESLSRIAESNSLFYHDYVEEPLVRSGMSELEMRQASSQVSTTLIPMVEQVLMWIYRRHFEHSTTEHIVEHVEAALEQAGLSRPRQVRPPAIVFLDLTGYTRLTEERGDEAAAELAATLAGLVSAASRRHGGRPIKWLGDGVMFHFADPAAAVTCSLEMVERTPAIGLPPAHVGVHSGPVVFRDGDYFGRTVNVASRIAGRASAGQVLVSDVVAEECRSDALSFDPIGPVELKGLARPVPLFRAARAA